MNIKNELLQEHSKQQAIKIANYIGNDPVRFEELIDLFLAKDYRVTQRAAWVVSHCADKHPELIIPHLKKMILNLKNAVPVAVVRNTFRVLQFIGIPEDLLGEIADIGFKIMGSKDHPVAVKVFAMTVLKNICQKEPGLRNELAILIEDQMPYASAGFRSRGRKVLKSLRD